MEAHTASAEVQEVACKVISRLGWDPGIISTMLSTGGLSRVCEAMSGHPRVAAVQEAACGALAHFAQYEGGKRAIIFSWGLDRLFLTMTAHLSSAGVQGAACSVIHHLAGKELLYRSFDKSRRYDHSEVASSFASSGVLDYLYAAMAAHRTVSDVQEHGCGALAHLAAHCGLTATIVSTGGLEQLYAAMAAHLPVKRAPDRDIEASERVQLTACTALKNLSVDAGSGAWIVSTGGLDHLFTAVRAHPRSEPGGLQEVAMQAFVNLSFNRVNLRPMRAAGVADVVRTALEVNPYNVELYEAGTELLAFLDQG